MGVVTRILVGTKGFGRLYRRYLLTGNIISSGILMSIGDLAEQYTQLKPKSLGEIDWGRNARLTVTGAGMGFINHYYYMIVDRIFPTATYKHVITKVIADQLIASPICIFFLFYCDGTLLGMSHDEIKDDLQSKFSTVYMADCSIWPPIQFINFRFVSARYRVLFLNNAQMFYNVLLSHLKYYDRTGEAKKAYKPADTKHHTKNSMDPRDKLGTRFTKIGEK